MVVKLKLRFGPDVHAKSCLFSSGRKCREVIKKHVIICNRLIRNRGLDDGINIVPGSLK